MLQLFSLDLSTVEDSTESSLSVVPSLFLFLVELMSLGFLAADFDVVASESDASESEFLSLKIEFLGYFKKIIILKMKAHFSS